MSALKKYLSQIFADKKLTCNICGREIFDGYFCSECNEKLEFNDGFICNHCGRESKTSEEFCNSCKQYNLSFDKARSAFRYGEYSSKPIMRLKYDNKRFIAEILADYMLPLYVKSFMDGDIITCVPSTEKRRRKRGYNQAELIGKSLAEKCETEFLPDILIKTKDTDSQVGLTRKEREKNLRSCFRLADKKSIIGKKIVVVDDVLTTGSTAEAIARVLKNGGAEQVYFITAASVQSENNK